jgi:hypothetical protein
VSARGGGGNALAWRVAWDDLGRIGAHLERLLGLGGGDRVGYMLAYLGDWFILGP